MKKYFQKSLLKHYQFKIALANSMVYVILMLLGIHGSCKLMSLLTPLALIHHYSISLICWRVIGTRCNVGIANIIQPQRQLGWTHLGVAINAVTIIHFVIHQQVDHASDRMCYMACRQSDVWQQRSKLTSHSLPYNLITIIHWLNFTVILSRELYKCFLDFSLLI